MGWGFESQDSDYDVRFVYAHSRDWYLSVAGRRDVIELPPGELLDINGWDLHKALRLLRKSNPTLLEWLQSPIVYREDAGALHALRRDILAPPARRASSPAGGSSSTTTAGASARRC